MMSENVLFRPMRSTKSGGAYCSIDQHLVEELKGKLNLVKPLMDEAEMKQFNDRKVREWLVDIKHTIYDADILLDKIETELDEVYGAKSSSYIHCVSEQGTTSGIKKLESKQGTTSGIKNIIEKLVPTTSEFKNIIEKLVPTTSEFKNIIEKLVSKQDTTSEIKNIIEKLVDLAEKGRCMHLTDRVARAADSYHQIQIPLDRFPTTALFRESDFLGRKEEREQIMARVLSPAGENKVDTIVIVGPGGLGKTALAQYVYSHAEVSRRFVRSWVYFPNGVFDLIKVTRAILESLGKRVSSFSTLPELQERLEEELGGKRFLVVLDDVRQASRDNWEELMAPVSRGVQGSKIIVTARNLWDASVVSSDYVVELKPMSVEDGWSLFSSKVFPDGDLSRHSKLEAIGKKIVLQCRGLPLAIKFLSGLLRFHQDEKQWENILESSLWELSREFDQEDKAGWACVLGTSRWVLDSLYDCPYYAMPSLLMSYSFLPSHLKRCFAYCSLLPRGYFSGEELVNLWIDEGFVQQTYDGRSMEDVGQSFLEELTSRSLFIKDKYGSWYTMHGFIHDLAQRVFEDFHERVDFSSPRFPYTDGKKIRHVSFLESRGWSGYIYEQRVAQFTPHSLQTFMTFHDSLSHPRCRLNDKMLEAILLTQHSLRVLCLRGTRISTLPDTIRNLKLLRYLDVSYTDVKQLPCSLFTLHTLRRLQCVGCDQLEAFNTTMAGLVSLRHFTLEGKMLHKAPQNLWQLNECSVKAVFYLPYDGAHLLGVSINIGKSAFSYSVPDYGLFACADHSVLLESLRPNTDLQQVSIQFFNGTRFPAWLVHQSYHNVASVELKHCQISFGSMPALGQLPSLRYLILEDVGHMKRLGREFYGCNDPFRSLEELSFEDMKEWEVWEPLADVAAGICCFPLLAKLYLLNCPRLKGRLPAELPALKELVLRGCRSLVDSCLVDNNFVVFSSLRSLVLEGCDFPGSFPVKGSQSTSLTSLRIKSFTAWKKLDVIGLQSLVFLEELVIDDCPMLETLPGECLALSSDEDEGSVDHFPSFPSPITRSSTPLTTATEEVLEVLRICVSRITHIDHGETERVEYIYEEPITHQLRLLG